MRLILLMVVGMGLLGARVGYGQEGVEVEVVEKGVVMEVEEEAVGLMQLPMGVLGEMAQQVFLGGMMMAGERTVSEQEKVTIEGRMREHAGVWLDWVERVCELSPVQKVVVGEMARTLRETKFTEKRERAMIVQYGLAESMPVVFPSKNGMAKNFVSAMHKELLEGEVLDEEQKGKLKVAIKERGEAHHEVYSGRVMNLFDKSLCFLPEQRAEILGSMLKSRTKLTGALYFFGPYSFTPFEPATRMYRYVKRHLSAEQKALLGKLDDNESYAFFYGNNLDEVQEAIDVDIAKRTETLRLLLAIRMRFYQGITSTNAGVSRILETASKGIQQQVMEEWRTDCLEQLKEYENVVVDEENSISIGLMAPKLDLEKNEFWSHTTNKLALKELTERRAAVIADADADFRVVLLDDELWLTAGQEESLRKLIVEWVVGDVCKHSEEGSGGLEVFFEMAHILHLIPEEEVSNILSEPQRVVWKRLKEIMPVEDEQVVLKLPEGTVPIGRLNTWEGEKEEEMVIGGRVQVMDVAVEAVQVEMIKIVVEPKECRPHAWEKGSNVTVGARFYEGDVGRMVGVAVDVMLLEVEEHENYVMMTLVTTAENAEQIKLVAKASEYCFEVMPSQEEQREAFAKDLKIEEVLGKPEVYRVSGVEDWGSGVKGKKLGVPGVGELPGRE